MDIDFNIPTIITKRNTDSSGSPISVKLIEVRQVMDSYNCIVLTQIPDELHRIYIEGFTEIFDIEKLNKKNFKVDYSQGIIYFHPFNVGKTISIEYYGTGYELISASRVFTKVDRYGNIIDTLESILERSKLQLDLIEALGGAIKVIERLDENIKSANNLNTYFDEKIPEATGLKNELDTIVTDAKGWKDQLHNDVQEGKKLQPLLHNDVIQGNQTKAELEQTITNAQDDIATIKATGNEIINITSSEWTYNGTSKMYEKQIGHNCNSENLHVTCRATDSKDALFLPWKPVGKSNILIKSDEAINVSVAISASYYKAQTTISDDIAEEVVNARKGKTSLLEKVDSIDMQLESIGTEKANLNLFVGSKETITSKSKQPIILNRYTKGIRDDAVVIAVQGNKNSNVEVTGITTPSQLSEYAYRDSVAMYVDNSGTPFDLRNIEQVTTYTIKLDNVTDIEKGIILDLTSSEHIATGNNDIIQGNKYSGIVEKVEGNIVTVTNWFKVGNTTIGQTPTNVDLCIVNPINKIWGLNLNMFLKNEHGTHESTAMEITLFNDKVGGKVSGIDLLAKTLPSDAVKYGYRIKKWDNGSYSIENGYIADGCQVGYYSSSDNIISFATENKGFEVTGDGRIKHNKIENAVCQPGDHIDPRTPLTLVVPTSQGQEFSILQSGEMGSYSCKIFSLSHQIRLICTEGKIITTGSETNYIDINANSCVELFSDGSNFYCLSN